MKEFRDDDRLYLDDLQIGQRFTSGTYVVDEEQIKAFARQFDPQPFHLDNEAAKNTLLSGLAASGWHTAAITMRLLIESGLPLAGSTFGTRSPVGTLSEWLYAEVSFAGGASVPLDPDPEERAIYLVEGEVEVEIAVEAFESPRLLIFHPGDRITVRATRPARLMFLGGAASEGNIWWNFVSSRRERIEQAKEDWKTGKFAPVSGETEFIPLPES